MHVSMMRRAGLAGLFLVLFVPAMPASDPPAPTATIEPLPGLSLRIRETGLRRLVHGGIASLAVDVDAAISVAGTAVTIALPEGISFIDGARRRSWKPEINPSHGAVVPFDLLAGRDGVFPIRIEATATWRGATIRRGLSHDLRIGVERPRLPRRLGAVEYRGAIGDAGGRP